MQAGIYVRISLDVAGEGKGVDRQEELCRPLVERKGWTVAEVYRDNDVSASKDRERPEYARMLADIEAGRIGAVAVYAIDRLTRKPVELEHFIDLVERHGTQLANVAGDVQLDTVQGRLTARIMGSVARAEAENIGKRVRDQKRQRAASGIPHKGRHRLYGYTGREKQPDGSWVGTDWEVIPDEAANIREAFTRRASGESTTAIARDFTARGIKTVSGRDWTSGVLGETLTKHVYYGKVTFKGEVIADSIFPALVDEDTWLAAQANLANDSAGTNTRRYLLSGILKCRHCLSPMKGNPSNKMYRCSTTYGGCGRLSVRIELADRWIGFSALDWAKSYRSAPPMPTRDYKAEEASLRADRTKWQDGYQAGLYTLAEAQGPIRELDAKIKAVVKDAVQSKPRMNAVTKRVMDYQKMNLAQKRAFISEQITDVVVGPALSRGNQRFNPARFEVHYTDGTIVTLNGDADPWDM